jgi:intracellular multiplication protein IcmL
MATTATTEKGVLEQVKLRNDFYKDGFRRLVWAVLASIILNVVLVVVVVMNKQQPPQRYFFSTNGTGQLIPVYPTSQPVMSNAMVLNWVSQNVPNIYQIDFVHYRNQLNALSNYFTPTGWAQFQTTFASQLTEIINNQYVVSAAPNGVPVVTGTGVFDGTYMWQIQMPLILYFQKDSTVTSRNILLTLVVARVNNVVADQLIGISQIIQQVQ